MELREEIDNHVNLWGDLTLTSFCHFHPHRKRTQVAYHIDAKMPSLLVRRRLNSPYYIPTPTYKEYLSMIYLPEAHR